jgi:hypothetical protein
MMHRRTSGNFSRFALPAFDRRGALTGAVPPKTASILQRPFLLRPFMGSAQTSATLKFPVKSVRTTTLPPQAAHTIPIAARPVAV